MIASARSSPARLIQGQLSLASGGLDRLFNVSITSGPSSQADKSYVVTLEDITDLVSAQRMAAWADVARRIVHEIKNPLTPIQLSAERLKRKYLKQIVDDPGTFQVCTDTIIRQVDDIGRMVDEFSAFARMPAPVMHREDIVELCRQSLFLQQSAHPLIAYRTRLPAEPLMIDCDATLVGRALTNLLQNAADAIEARLADAPSGSAGEIWLRLEVVHGDLVIAVEDNGRGLPKVERHRLTEPYVTMRAKGTGLGLAIVKKIMEDHGGNLILDDRPGGGASVKLIFANRTSAAQAFATGARVRLFQTHGA